MQARVCACRKEGIDICYAICVYVCPAGSLETFLPRLIAWSQLWTTIAITTITTIIIISNMLTTVQLPGILNHLQLEVPRKPNELLMLLQSRLNWKRKMLGQGLRDARKVKGRIKNNSPPVYHQEKGNLWHSYCGQQDASEQSH